MIQDAIVDEIHKIRRKHAESFNFDINAICDDYRKKEKKSKLKLVALPPKRFLKQTGS